MKKILSLFILLLVSTLASADQREAIKDYENWLTKNGANLSILYNLGNAYYENKDYGKSILAYEKALALKPTDRTTKSNLQLARKAAGLENVPINRYGPLGVLSYNSWAKQLLFAAFLILLTFIIPKLKRMHIHLKPIRIVRYISCTILLLAIAALIVRKPELSRAVVVSKETKIRVSPFETAEAVKSLKLGEIIQLIDQHKDFYQVDKGWVSSEQVKKVYE